MKRLLLCGMLFFLCSLGVNAQATNDTIYQVGVTPPPAARNRALSRRLGEHLVICDQVYSSRTVNDKIKILYIGADKPDQVVIVVLMGECYPLDVKKMIGKKICFKGLLSERKGEIHLVLSRLDQITGYREFEEKNL